MNPNLALSRLADRVQPDEAGMLWVRDHLAALEVRVIKAFPRSRLVPIGSYSRGTAIAVHSNVDTLAVLPREWATIDTDVNAASQLQPKGGPGTYRAV